MEWRGWFAGVAVSTVRFVVPSGGRRAVADHDSEGRCVPPIEFSDSTGECSFDCNGRHVACLHEKRNCSTRSTSWE
jgi:hypothetical protein